MKKHFRNIIVSIFLFSLFIAYVHPLLAQSFLSYQKTTFEIQVSDDVFDNIFTGTVDEVMAVDSIPEDASDDTNLEIEPELTSIVDASPDQQTDLSRGGSKGTI